MWCKARGEHRKNASVAQLAKNLAIFRSHTMGRSNLRKQISAITLINLRAVAVKEGGKCEFAENKKNTRRRAGWRFTASSVL